MDENENIPFYRRVGYFKKSAKGNGINLKIGNRFLTIPISEMNSVMSDEQERGEIREYQQTEKE